MMLGYQGFEAPGRAFYRDHSALFPHWTQTVLVHYQGGRVDEWLAFVGCRGSIEYSILTIDGASTAGGSQPTPVPPVTH